VVRAPGCPPFNQALIREREGKYIAKPRIFISYDYDNHNVYKSHLVTWDKNDEFDFAFSDHSAEVTIQSTNADSIKKAIEMA
jgi:hypothetical protein